MQGDYYLPDLLPAQETRQPIGVWGHHYLQYIKQYKKIFYPHLMTSGNLNGYLANIDEQAQDLFFHLVKQMAEREGITEKLKLENPMEWENE